jgi:hypothetical protein
MSYSVTSPSSFPNPVSGLGYPKRPRKRKKRTSTTLADNAAAEKAARRANLTHKAGTTVEHKGDWLIELHSVDGSDLITAKAYRKSSDSPNGSGIAIDAHALFSHGCDADRAYDAIATLIAEQEKVAKLLAHSGLNR